MSGPKSSVSLLDERIRREQEEQRRRLIEEEKCKSLETKIKNLNEQIAQKVNQFSELKERTNVYDQEGKPILGSNENRLKVISVYEMASKLLINHSIPPKIRDSKQLSSYVSILERVISEGNVNLLKMKTYMVAFEVDVKEYNISLAEKAYIEKSSTFSKQNKERLHLFETNTVNNSFSIKEEIDRFVDRLEPYLHCSSESIRKEISLLKESILDIFDDKKLDSYSKLEQIKLREKLFLVSKESYYKTLLQRENQIAIFQDLSTTYHSLCTLLDHELKKFSIEEIDVLKVEIEEKQIQLKKIQETKFISETIDEIMFELGYEMKASEMLSSPIREVVHNVYQFQKGNVINAFTSDNGSILFEVTGNKETNELTNLEKLRIKEGMDDFCEEYPKIKEKLRERGIELTNENLKPADVRYARAINLEKLIENNDQQAKSKKKLNHRLKTESRKMAKE